METSQIAGLCFAYMVLGAVTGVVVAAKYDPKEFPAKQFFASAALWWVIWLAVILTAPAVLAQDVLPNLLGSKRKDGDDA